MRKLSQIPATDLTGAITGPQGKPLVIRQGKSFVLANSLRAYDALADDRLPASPCTSGTISNPAKNSTLLSERYSTPEGKVLGHSYTGANVRSVIAGGTHPLVNRRKWLEANSLDNILLPSGGGVCGKCGYDRHCTCPKPVWAGGSPVIRVKPEEPKAPVVNGGIWLRGTKIHAILP